MAKYDIKSATFQWLDCPDTRPWLLLDPVPTGVMALPISSHAYNNDYCFEIELGHPDFGPTGLKNSCFIHYESIIILPTQCLGVHRGSLCGELLADFQRITQL